MSQSIHKPVLLKEIVQLITNQRSTISDTVDRLPVYLDGTFGGGGHALAIARALQGRLVLIGLDQDPSAIQRARQTFASEAETCILECENFRNLDKILDRHGIGEVDFILLDLGMSSDQLENSGRGFSFLKNEPLLMTMGDPSGHFTAKDVVNNWKADDIANVIYAYGEERFARRIARAIVSYREKKVIETSSELAEIVRVAIPAMFRRGNIHPATKTFQALRIAVNDELKALEEGLNKGRTKLARNGLLAVISFHSLEDRIVKQYFKKLTEQGEFRAVSKLLRASDEEIRDNPRSRSAKLRVIQKQS